MTVPPAAGDHPRSLLVVGGSGRSGTSLFAGLAYRLGYHIPQPELKANDTNPRGFGEPRWAIAFHKDLLRSVDVTHDDGRPQAWVDVARVNDRKAAHDKLTGWLSEQFDLSARVVVKDPRLAWFVGLYAGAAKELSADFGVVTMLRHPAETVRSKELAYGGRIESTTRMAGWLNMMLHVEEQTRGMARAVVRYDDLLTRWRPTLAAVEQALAINLVSGRDDEELAAADALVDPQLRRTELSWDGLILPEPLRELAERSFDALEAIAVSVDGAANQAPEVELDELRVSYADLYGDAEAMVRSSLNAARAKERRRVTKESRNQQRKARVARREAPTRQPAAPAGADAPVTRSARRVADGLKARTSRLLSRRT